MRVLGGVASSIAFLVAGVHSLAIVPGPSPDAVVTVAIDPNADRRPVSPLIFGVNFGSASQANRLHWPVRRWGGNSTTRYSWQHDISSRASDWFFYNIEESNPNPSTLPDGSAADRFVDETRSAGGDPLVTVPLIGWTPIDRVRRWGFSVARYGAQQQTECTATGNAYWCQPDAGNGLHANGTPVTGNDPHDTSREIGPSFVTGWMAHLAARTGTAGAGGVRFYALDNEPMLWNSTHRDVHPEGTTYDELWLKTMNMAAAMKAQDPAAKVFGPALWGWCAYFFSGADGCSAGADAAAHGNLGFLEWYLQQAAAYEAAHGVRLIDYADIHYYPQASGVALSDDESAATSARRLRSLKGLYDPAYTDESWIGQPVRLIPRMKEWIAARYPGTKLAITEYSWGNDDGLSSALAQAEALAIFAREGVDLATRWVAPADGSVVEDSFLLYLNYDGLGARVAGSSVRATSSSPDDVGAYAIAGAGGRVFILLFNKGTVSNTAAVTLPGAGNGAARVFGFSSGSRLGALPAAAFSSNALSLVLPARSARLVEAAFAAVRPTAAVSGTATICAGGSTPVSAALTGTGPWNVTWSDGQVQNGVASSPAIRTVNPPGTTAYAVTALSDQAAAAQAGDLTGGAVVTVTSLPAVASMTPPAGAAGVVTGSVSWTATNATSYDVYFDTVNPPQKKVAVGTTSASAPSPVWFANTAYYWQVVAHGGCGNTTGPVYGFTTGACAFTGAVPTLSTPANGAANQPIATTLSWSALAGTSHYDVYVGTTDPPTLRYAAVYTPATSLALSLSPGKTYYWQVTAIPVCGNGAAAASAVRSFTTATSTLTLSSASPASMNRWTGGSLSVLGTGFLATSTPFTDLEGSAAGAFTLGSWTSTQVNGTLGAGLASPAGRYDVGLTESGVERGRLQQALILKAFTDVNETQFFFESSSRVADAGIMESDMNAGVAGPQFAPTTVVTRALMAEYLAKSYQWLRTRSTGLSAATCVASGAGSTDFPDVACSHPNWLAIHWIKTWGITAGAACPAGSGMSGLCYQPDTSITRGQMVTFLTRLKYGAEGTGTVLQGLLNAQGTLDPGCGVVYPACSGWTDAGLQNAPAVWPHNFVNVGYQDRMTAGCSGSTPPLGFCTGALITRGQMAEFLGRVIGLVPTP